MPRYIVGATSPVGSTQLCSSSGDLGTQRFGGPFHLTGAYLYSRQFAQQIAAFDKAHQRCDMDHGGVTRRTVGPSAATEQVVTSIPPGSRGRRWRVSEWPDIGP